MQNISSVGAFYAGIGPFYSKHNLLIKILIRYAHAADPVYYLRLSSLRQLNTETRFCSLYRAQTPRPTTQAQGTKGTQGPNPKGPRGTKGPRDQRARGQGPGTKGIGAKGGQRGPSGPLGYFRSYSEWMVITSACSEWKAISNNTKSCWLGRFRTKP